MTKRASGKFKRSKNDLYNTPMSGLLPLLPHLLQGTRFDEPCVGEYHLKRNLESHGHIAASCSDINGPQKVDVFSLRSCHGDMFITNPPWTREILHPLITHLSDIAPTWLFFDADWMHTKQAIPFKERCSDIVSIGRVSWMGNGVSGFDNCAWYRFDHLNTEPTKFHWRT